MPAELGLDGAQNLVELAIKRRLLELRHHLPPAELPVEFMMNGLRLTGGVETSLVSQKTGLSYEVISDVVDRLVSWELMQPNRLQTTDRGYAQLDSVVGQFHT